MLINFNLKVFFSFMNDLCFVRLVFLYFYEVKLIYDIKKWIDIFIILFL